MGIKGKRKKLLQRAQKAEQFSSKEQHGSGEWNDVDFDGEEQEEPFRATQRHSEKKKKKNSNQQQPLPQHSVSHQATLLDDQNTGGQLSISFECPALNLHPNVVSALRENRFLSMTEIQKRVLPVALSMNYDRKNLEEESLRREVNQHNSNSCDLLAQAKTGSGKTLAFLIPIFHEGASNPPRQQRSSSSVRHCFALILSPTKELALQTHRVCVALGTSFGSINSQPQDEIPATVDHVLQQETASPHLLSFESCLVTGGTNINTERKVLLGGAGNNNTNTKSKSGDEEHNHQPGTTSDVQNTTTLQIVVATPGRILDHVRTYGSLEKKQWGAKHSIDQRAAMEGSDGNHVPFWSCATLRFLVLDEADRMLDQGFSKDLDAILDALEMSASRFRRLLRNDLSRLVPSVGGTMQQHGSLIPSRRTFLFSATGSKSVQHLARLSLKGDVVYFVSATSGERPTLLNFSNQEAVFDDVETDEEEEGEEEGEIFIEQHNKDAREDAHLVPSYAQFYGLSATSDTNVNEVEGVVPEKLRQFSYTCRLEHRLVALYYFIKRLCKGNGEKMMIFCSTVSSTMFHFQMMGSLGFHDDVFVLHGKMKHKQRLATFDAFVGIQSGVLFCTDVAARGLDIPQVSWIIQLDPPIDPTEYIHRIGRTARANNCGNALIFLTQDEAPGFLNYLSHYQVTKGLTEYQGAVLPRNIEHVERMMEAIARVVEIDPVVARTAVGACRAYVAAYASHLLKDVFSASNLNPHAVAAAFGLQGMPSGTVLKSQAQEDQQEDEELEQSGANFDDRNEIHLTGLGVQRAKKQARAEGNHQATGPREKQHAAYVKGQLKAINKKRIEAAKLYDAEKTKPQWDTEGNFIGRRVPRV